MDDPPFFRQAQVCIIGLGLMGGSLGLALRDHVGDITAVDTNPDTRQQAFERGIASQVAADLSLARKADVVILATPVRTIIRHIAELSIILKSGSVLLDLGSVKAPVVRAMAALPPRIAAVGGHPMCGKATSGLAAASASLYHGARFVLCYTDRTTDAAWTLAHQIVEAAGAVPVEMGPDRHDQAVALISHMPYLLSAGLALAADDAAQEDQAVCELAASGFRDMSRLAGSDPDVLLDILLANSPAVLAALDAAETHFSELANLIREGDTDNLRSLLAQAQFARRKWEEKVDS